MLLAVAADLRAEVVDDDQQDVATTRLRGRRARQQEQQQRQRQRGHASTLRHASLSHSWPPPSGAA